MPVLYSYLVREKKPHADRDFVEFDMDNFDERMERIAPRAAFAVENTLTGEGRLGVDLTRAGAARLRGAT